MKFGREVKVTILTSVHSPFDIRVFYKEARSLVRAGCTVTLIAPHSREEEVEGVRIVPLPRARGRLRRILFSPWRIFRLALRHKADVYHFHDPELIPAGILLRLCRKKVIYDIHENVTAQVRNKKWLPARNLFALLYRVLELVALRLFALVLAEASYARLYPRHRRKVVVQNFPDLELFPPPSTEKHSRFTACYLGGVSALRGIDRVFEALALLRGEGKVIDFLCIGPASEKYSAHLQHRAAELGITDQVELPGRMEAPRAYRLLQQCHTGLAVLQPNPNYYESFPTKMFEYMVLGLPVIVSDFPLWREVVEKAGCGYTVDPTDAEALARILGALADDLDLTARMGARGRTAVEKEYSWQQEEQKLLDLYAGLL